jgi:iron complex outermembrane receptor protein
MRRIMWSAGLVMAGWPVGGWAQQTPAAPTSAPGTAPAAKPADDSDPYADPSDIVVTAQREPGTVASDVKPELQLSPADVRSYGVSSIGDLLTELAPETSSGRGSGAPAVLLNGRRISDFRELRDLPTEAILRVDILPEQVALDYGFSADQKVVNIVLRQHFEAQTIELRDSAATEGGTNTPRGSLGIVHLTPTGRFSLNLDYTDTSKLLESERDVTGQPARGAYDLVGNITPAAGASEIDPALSTAAGTPVTIAGVPASAATTPPTLGDFVPTANTANTTDLSHYRTLAPATRDFKANAVYARTIFGNVSATANGAVEYSDSTADLGLPGVALTLPAGNPYSPFSDAVTLSRYVDTGGALQQTGQTLDAHVGTTFDGQFSKWNWSLTGNYDRTETKTFTDTGVDATALQAALNAGDPAANPFGNLAPLLGAGTSNYADSVSNDGKIDLLLNGSPFSLPSGAVRSSIHLGLETSDFTSLSRRYDTVTTGDVSRDTVNGRLNLTVPITSRSRDFLAPLGDLYANVNLAADHLSDFGTLTTVGYGINWSPISPVHAVVSFTNQGEAPSAQQLGNPLLSTPNSRVFDYVTGQTVDITRITGGNPDLAEQTRHVFEAELNVKPLTNTDLTLIATYTAVRTNNAIADLPAATAAIEAAFPDRFNRDAAGDLVSVDARPVNFDEEDTKQLRWGFNLRVPIKSKIQKEFEAYREGKGSNPLADIWRQRRAQRQQGGDGKTPPPPADSHGDGPPPAGGGPGGDHGGGFHGGGGGYRGGRGGFGGDRRGSGRLQFAVYHTWRFEDQVHIRSDLPVLDLLNGDSTGATGGTPRHQVDVQAGYFNNGLGARLSATWQSGTTVDGGTPAAPETLNFSPLATLNFRLFADLGNQLHFVAKHPWARGLRVSLSANNLLDSRQRVTDQNGLTPISYQPDYLDPVGRTVMISIRKLFFQRSAR